MSESPEVTSAGDDCTDTISIVYETELEKTQSIELKRADIIDALSKIGLPQSYASEFFRQANRTSQGVLHYDDFSQFVLSKEDGLRNLFDYIDVEKAGAVDVRNLLSALQRVGLNPTPEDVQKVFSSLDHDKGNRISYPQFRRAIGLMQPMDLMRLFGNTQVLWCVGVCGVQCSAVGGLAQVVRTRDVVLGGLVWCEEVWCGCGEV